MHRQPSRSLTLAVAALALLASVGFWSAEVSGFRHSAFRHSAMQGAPGPAKGATQPEGRRPNAEGRALRVLFLGHTSPHHPSMALMPILAAPLARKGIQLTHVATPEEALRPEVLAHYDALMIYANHKTLTEAQEQALVSFVEGGKGLIALHCASAMFTEAARYIPLVGGEFSTHGTGDFSAEIVTPDHPIMRGLAPFTTWDETYVHKRHNPVDRTVLMERVDDKGREPYTWVRTQGKGRVFYTAFGHDERTWRNPGFQQLVEQATVWAVSDSSRQAWQQLKVPAVTYLDGFNVPNYERRDPAPKYQMPFSPADSMKFIQVPAEFDLQLFAQEPDIIKPIAFSFDARGRLWVIEAIDYPNLVLNGEPGADRIKILEDTNADGRADKFTVFADRLNLATSLVHVKGGVVVAAAPHMLLLEDTNGDDKADKRTVLSTGWGISDSHAGPSSLLYGPDNYIWGTVGYAGFKGEMNGRPMQFSQGVFRFKPDGSAFEFVTGSTNNTWGLGFSETFDVFGSTANNDPSFYVAIPNRYFEGVEGFSTGARPASGLGYQSAAQFYAAHFITPYIRQVDVHGGYTAAAGHQLYTARRFPKAYWNRIAFITEPTAHLVGQGIMEKDGAGFVTRDGYNLLAGAEEWVSPVQAQAGPDGAVWVADWYNFINQHNPTPPGYSNGPGNAYETSMRDRHRGRIYRVVPKGTPEPRTPALSAPARSPARSAAATTSELVATLSSDNMLWRLHAQRLLVERGGQDAVPALVALTRNTSVDEVGVNGGAQHAVWTLDGLGAVQDLTSDAGRTLVAALKHPAAGVRKAAATVVATRPGGGQAIVDAALLRDSDLHTRLAAILALADAAPSDAIAKALYAASLEPANYGDRWLSRALYVAAHRHRERFLTLYRADPAAVPVTALPLPLRLGSNRPDWRLPDAAAITAAWKDMEVPGNWEAKGLPNFDGVVWFTRTFDVSSPAPTKLSFGRINQAAEIWVNGQSVPAPPRDPAAPNALPVFTVPDEALRAGSNTLTLRIQNYRGDGGFLSPPDLLYVERGGTRQSLGGTWKSRVERQTNAATLYAKPGELAAHLALATTTATSASNTPSAPAARPDITIALSVVPGQMKFDRADLTVAPGQLVQLVFTNPDVMQHNFILGAIGSLVQLGAAADQMLTTGDALAQSYVPQTPLVLFSTSIVDPGQTITVQFRAPSQAGAYPYACTFPGHWRIMNGTLTVKANGSP